MTWAIVITGITCDEHEIVVLRDRIVNHMGGTIGGTLTIQEWLFNDYWHNRPTPETVTSARVHEVTAA